MEDKLTNLIIAVIFIIVILLAGLFGYKLLSSKNEEAVKPSYESNINVTEKEQSNINSSITNETNNNQKEVQNIKIPISNTNENANIDTNITNTNIPSKTVSTNVEVYPYNNRYYYYQLNSYSKSIYDTIIKNMDKLKTGNNRMKIDYDFTKLINEKDGKEKLSLYYGDAINALNLDIPNLFYIDLSKLSLRYRNYNNNFWNKI